MEEKDVIISISGSDAAEFGGDSFELVTDGKYHFADGSGHLSYMESELTGLTGTRTSFTVDKAGIVMLREGNLNSRMVFEEGKKHFFLYDTPYGAATMGVNTRRVQTQFGEHGGGMEIDYVIDFEHAVVGRHNLKIDIREQRQGGVTH
ncbi:MAG: DUF1934 domain-containing protein [Firmicutes bacterium]|nr:DUF1934 domain-containing protein [Bacillota bacterium]